MVVLKAGLMAYQMVATWIVLMAGWRVDAMVDRTAA